MIYYDPHRWRSLARWHGSVIPRAALLAIPSAVLAYALKWLQENDLLSFDGLENASQNSVYSGFTFVIGFSLVFRTSQSYARYWQAATSVHTMKAEWFDACASLVAFAQMSKKPHQEVLTFTHIMVRLFSLLHAMALEEIADMATENFPILDVQGIEKSDLIVLTNDEVQGKKLELVLCWIKAAIVQQIDQGLLNVPPPILTRVFQSLGSGLVSYHSAKQVVVWPFPFPYTQMNFVLLSLYMLVTPLVITAWASNTWQSVIFSFTSVLCMLALDLISSELENPFGDDPNDLPCFEMQHDMNQQLLLLVHPSVCAVPKLLHSALPDYEAFRDTKSLDKMSLQQYHEMRRSSSALANPKFFASETSSTGRNGGVQLHSMGTEKAMGRIGTLQSLQSVGRGARIRSESSGSRRSTRNMSRKLQRQLAWAHQDYSSGRDPDHMHLRRALDICREDFTTGELAEVKEETASALVENLTPGLSTSTSSNQLMAVPHQAVPRANSSGSSPRTPGAASAIGAADLRGVAVLELDSSLSADFEVDDYTKTFGRNATISSWRHSLTRNGTGRSTLHSGSFPEAADFQKLHRHEVLHQELHGSLSEVSSSLHLVNMHVQRQTALQERQASAMEALLRHVRRAEQLPQSQGPQLEAPATQRPFGWLGGLQQVSGAKAAQPPPPPPPRRLQTIVDEDQHPGQERASNRESPGLSCDLPPQQPHQAASRGRQELETSFSPPASQPPELHRSLASSQS